MKNLILTFVLALVSLVSVSQTLTYTVYHYTDETSTTRTLTHTTTAVVVDTIYMLSSDSLSIGTTDFYSVIHSTTSQNLTSQEWLNDTTTNKLGFTANETLIFNHAGSTTHFKLHINVTANQSASTSENTLTREELKVYPSPATSETKISFFADKSDMVVNIFSLNGQLIYQDDASREVGMINVLELNVSEWASGVYLVNNGKETFKFVVL